MKKRIALGASILGVGAIIGGILYAGLPQDERATLQKSTKGQIFVGGDLHTLTALGRDLYVTGHEGAGRSSNQGVSWSPIKSLANTDVMGWSKTTTSLLVGGHEGLYISSDGGSTFSKVKFFGDISDVHSIGAVGDTVYLASPQIGLLISNDGGKTWSLRNGSIGQGFMGSMLVDPANPDRIFAPDMQAGLVTSSDGGSTWTSVGGPTGTMSITWNPTNIQEFAVIGMGGSAISKDGGRNWSSLNLPIGASSIAFSSDGKKMHVAVHVGVNAQVLTSTDNGVSWNAPIVTGETKNYPKAMDPNMPGMDHSQTSNEPLTTPRPIALTLGVFGISTSGVLLSAIATRRKDRLRKLTKVKNSTGRKSIK